MLLKWSIRALAALGGLALALLAYLVVTYSLARARERSPRVSDLAYVLSWSNINSRTRIERIDCAYASTRNWLVGDQTKVYTFRVNSALSLFRRILGKDFSSAFEPSS